MDENTGGSSSFYKPGMTFSGCVMKQLMLGRLAVIMAEKRDAGSQEEQERKRIQWKVEIQNKGKGKGKIKSRGTSFCEERGESFWSKGEGKKGQAKGKGKGKEQGKRSDGKGKGKGKRPPGKFRAAEGMDATWANELDLELAIIGPLCWVISSRKHHHCYHLQEQQNLTFFFG